MAKYYGDIGFIELKEVDPGVWAEVIYERKYYGDIIRSGRRLENSDNISDNIRITNIVSVVVDDYILNHIFAIRYVKYMESLWKASEVELIPPRITLTLGGVYNAEQA